MRLAPALGTLFVLLAFAGCGDKGGNSSAQTKDPHAGMTTQQKIEALRKDPKLNSMEREARIAELQKQGP